MGKFIDLTGQSFGRWHVVEQAPSRVIGGKKVVFWVCKCQCGTVREVNGRALRDGTSRSCGCLQKEKCAETCKSRRKKNEYKANGDTVTVQTNGGAMLCDKRDWDTLSKYYWRIGKDGYAFSCIDNKFKKFHVLILDCPDGCERDHINGNRADNRRVNLRIVPASSNRLNKGIDRRNKTGHAGVFWYDKYQKYQAYIQAHGKSIHLGYFENYEDAVSAREEAEKKLFGKYRRT